MSNLFSPSPCAMAICVVYCNMNNRIRLNKETGLLSKLTEKQAWDEAIKNKDFIFADSSAEAEFISKGFSDWQGRR